MQDHRGRVDQIRDRLATGHYDREGVPTGLVKADLYELMEQFDQQHMMLGMVDSDRTGTVLQLQQEYIALRTGIADAIRGVTITVTLPRRIVWRLRVGLWLMKVGGRVSGCSFEVAQREED